MNNKEIIEKIEAKMLKIHQEALNGLKLLNEQQTKVEKTQPNTCDEAYYRNVARYAWAYRAKTIAMLELQGVINEIKKEIN